MKTESKKYTRDIECDICHKVRTVDYRQVWNIKNGKCNNFCLSCAAKNGKTHNNFGENRADSKTLSEALKLAYKEGRKIVPDYTGDKNPCWRGGVTSKDKLFRNSNGYIGWRNEVYKRDNYTCQCCGQVGGRLHAHHIIPFSFDKNKRLDIENGQTLCVECHKKTDTYLSGVFSYENSI